MQWQIKISNDLNYQCWLSKRPTLRVREIEQEDGTFKIGEAFFEPLILDLDCEGEHLELPPDKTVPITLTLSQDETALEEWSFEGTIQQHGRSWRGLGLSIHFESCHFRQLGKPI